MGGVAKCPSCTIDLGNATSLLASKLVEAVKHECEHDGCKEMVAFLEFEQHKQTCSFRPVPCNHPGCKEMVAFLEYEQHKGSCSFRPAPCNHPGCKEEVALKDFEKHKQACLFRPVQCPASRCTNIVSISKLEEHWKVCSLNETTTAERENNRIWWEFTNLFTGVFTTSRILSHGKMFFLKINKSSDSIFLETVMTGTEAECEKYVARITVPSKDLKSFASMSSHPRPLDEQAWGTMGLTLSKKDMMKIMLSHPITGAFPTQNSDIYSFRMKLTICKI